MTTEERKIFWETLCSLKGENTQEESEILGKLTNLYAPKEICRFRRVSPRTLEALKFNKVYFSSADYYDDPFDTFLYIDYKKIKEEIVSYFSNPDFCDNLMRVATLLGLPKDNIFLDLQNKTLAAEKIADSLIAYMKGDERNLLQKSSLSICFSENALNENLWLKYAENHKGFVLVYDMRDPTKFLCGKSENCKKCPSFNGAPIYPVYYSNEKYDATTFSKNYAIACAASVKKGYSAQGDDIIDNIINNLPPMWWEREKIALIKKECHKYDEEWRMIASFYAKGAYIKWIPKRVVLGLKMPLSEKEFIASVAIDAGIEEITETYIDDENNLNERCYKKGR